MNGLDSGQLPLAGVKVIEFCSIAAGPFCGMLLADMGADVTKVEAPGGDALRQWPPLTDGYSENFASLNRNKQSFVLNLNQPDSKELAPQLIRGADVVIENKRTEVIKRLGLDFASFAKTRHELLYCTIYAYGKTGTRAAEGR